MRIIRQQITKKELQEIAIRTFGNFVKAVVDVDREIMAVDGELHSDEEALLLENGSKQQDLWGINLYPEKQGDDFIEFDSVINIKPASGNKTRGVDNPEIRNKITKIVGNLIK